MICPVSTSNFVLNTSCWGTGSANSSPLISKPIKWMSLSLRMNLVLVNFIRVDWLKGAQAYVQRDGSNLDAALLKLIENCARKMQPGGRRRYGSGMIRKDRLVALGMRAASV